MHQTNCYLVYDDTSRQAIVVDPGEEASVIVEKIDKFQLNVIQIILTHGHGDHISAVDTVRNKYSVEVAIGKDDAEMLTNATLNLSEALGIPFTLNPAEVLLSEGDTITVDKHVLKVVDTPGHTAGGITLVGNGFVISGDLIFAGSIGRTDLPGGDYNTIIDSIKQKVIILDDKTVIYPGHGPKTNVGQEKIFNPFLIGG